MTDFLFLAYPIIGYFILGIFFASVGSLLNVIIYRLPLMLQAEWKAQCCELLGTKKPAKSKKINLFYPRSFCPQCTRMITAWQNIPMLSYLFLKGRCHHCQQKIPLRYPLVEALTLGLFFLALWYFGFSLQLPFVLVFIDILICLLFIDLDHQILPDSLTLSLLWLGLLANTQNLFTSLPNAVFSAVGGYLFLWLFIKFFYLMTGKIGMGNGDFKLFAAFGAWFGGMVMPFLLLFASLIGAVFGIAYLKINKKSKDTPIPFGPFLCIAGLVTLFWGKPILNWYLKLYF